VSYLLGAADRISRGDLEEPVGLDSNDELGQLARAIERMRVSLQEGMERLRNRR
jgi:HAMP domain-containing protein